MSETISFISIYNPEIKHAVEVSGFKEFNNYNEISLRYTKSNLLMIGNELCRPRRIQIFRSGKCRLWFSYPKGKTFHAGCWPMEIVIIDEK